MLSSSKAVSDRIPPEYGAPQTISGLPEKHVHLSLDKYRVVVPAVLSLIVGYVLKGSPSDPDQEFLPSNLIGTLLIFFFFAISLVSWGSVACRLLKASDLGWLGRVGFGTIILSLLNAIQGHLGLIAYTDLPLTVLILASGILLDSGFRLVSSGPKHSHGNLREVKSAAERTAEGGFFLILVIAVLSRGIQAFLMHGTTDPHLYHLLGPRMWVDEGRIFLPHTDPIVFNASFWEYLFIPGNILLGSQNGGGLIEGQLFGQWVHALIGTSLCLFSLQAVLRPLAKRRYILLAALLAATCGASLRDVSWLAKNDLGAIGWTLFGMVLLERSVRTGETKRWSMIAGGVCGIAAFSKLNMMFTLFPAGLFWAVAMFLKRGTAETLRNAGLLFLGALMATSPVWARNLYYTGNPFFPFFELHYWSSVYSWTWRAMEYKQAPQFLFWPSQLLSSFTRIILRENIIFLSVPFGAIAALAARPSRRAYVLWACGLFGLICFLSAKATPTFGRWAGPPLLLLPALTGLSTVALFDLMPNLIRKICISSFCILIAVVSLLELPRHFWMPITHWESPIQAMRNPRINIGGDSKAWLRLNAPAGARILTTGDNLTYFISHLHPWVITSDARLDNATYELRSPAILLRLLHDWHVEYALDSLNWEGHLWSRAAALLNDLVNEHPETIAYAGMDSQVINVHRLLEETRQSCLQVDDPAGIRPLLAVAESK